MRLAIPVLVKHKNRRVWLGILAVSGLLGLAPVWYQFQNSNPVKTSFAQGPEVRFVEAVLSPLWVESSSPSRPTNSETHPTVQNHTTVAHIDRETEALDPQSRAAIEAFQTNATLSQGRIDPEVAAHVGVESRDDSATR